jgi:hypothetical protein
MMQRRGRELNPHGPDRVRPEVLDNPTWLHNTLGLCGHDGTRTRDLYRVMVAL